MVHLFWCYLKRIWGHIKPYFVIEEGNIIVAFHMSKPIQGRLMVHSDAIWNCRESFENRDAKFCILMLFEMKFWNYRETLDSQNAKWCFLTLSKPMSALISKDTFHGLDEWSMKMKVVNISCAVTLHPLSPRFLMKISIFLFFDFWKWWYAQAYVPMPSYGPENTFSSLQVSHHNIYINFCKSKNTHILVDVTPSTF